MNQTQQKLVLFTIEAYLDEINDETTYNYPFMIKLRTAIRGYMQFHKFSPDEYAVVKDIADTEFMKSMVDVEVDRTIFSLELLYLYVKEIPKKDRANLNISDKKLLGAKVDLVMDMLKLKKDRPDSYLRVKEIVTDSRIAAKKYFMFIEEYK